MLRWLLLSLVAIISMGKAAPEDLKVMVLIPEQIIRRPVPDPAAETEIARVLIQQQFRVVDIGQTQRIIARDEMAVVLRSVGSRQALIDLGLKFGADVLITGEAFAEEIVPQPVEVRNAGLKAYQARLEVKAIDLSSGQLFISEAFTGSGLGLADGVAGKTAIQKTAERAAPIVAARLAAWETGNTRAGRVFILKVSNLENYKALTDLLEKIRGITNVRSAKSRQFDSNSAEIEISYVGDVEKLAGELNSIGLVITNVNGGEIRASTR